MKLKLGKHVAENMIAGFLLWGNTAGGDSGDIGGSPSSGMRGAMSYHSFSVNFALPGYASAVAPVPVVTPKVSYQSQAYGPAIHQYPQVGTSAETALNLSYQSLAYGPFIYSYPAVGAQLRPQAR